MKILMNSPVQSTLEDALLRLFVRAVSEEELEVAEHLLCALEAFAKTSENAKASLDTAYSVVAFQACSGNDPAAVR